MKAARKLNVSTYADGLHFKDSRELTAAERTTIQSRINRLRWKNAAALAAAPLAMILPLIAATQFPDSAWVSLLFIGGVVGLVWFGSIVVGHLRQIHALRDDLQQGNVAVHRGVREDENGNEEEFLMEMLPVSGIVVATNDYHLDARAAPELLAQVQVADLPAGAAIAASWLEPASAPEAAIQMFTNRRELSSEESDELRGHQRTMIWNGWFILYGFDVFFVATLWAQRRALLGENSPELWYWLAVVAALGYAHKRPFRQLTLARKLAADRASGVVVILQSRATERPPDPNDTHDTEDTDARLPVSPVFEVLPVSHIVWTVGGVPARWRTDS